MATPGDPPSLLKFEETHPQNSELEVDLEDSEGAFNAPSLDDEDEDARTMDLWLMHLVIAVSNCTSGQIEISHSTVTETAAERLLRCMGRVIAEKRRMFLQFRLQALVFEYSRKARKGFELPDSFCTPRSIQSLKAREAWWWTLSASSDIQRKDGSGLRMAESRSSIKRNSLKEVSDRMQTKARANFRIDRIPTGRFDAPEIIKPEETILPIMRRSQSSSSISTRLDSKSKGGMSPESSPPVMPRSFSTTTVTSNPGATFHSAFSLYSTKSFAGIFETSFQSRALLETPQITYTEEEVKENRKVIQSLMKLGRSQSKKPLSSSRSITSPVSDDDEDISTRLPTLPSDVLGSMNLEASSQRGFSTFSLSPSPASSICRPQSMGSLRAPQPLAPWIPCSLSSSLGKDKENQSTDTRSHHASGLVCNQISVSMKSDLSRQKATTIRRQDQIDCKVDRMCCSEEIAGLRRFIRHRNSGTKSLAAEYKEPEPAAMLPPPPRLAPLRRTKPEGAAQCESIAKVYVSASLKQQCTPGIPKCLAPKDLEPTLQGTPVVDERDPIILDLRNMNLVDAEAVPIIEGLEKKNVTFKALILAGNPRLTDKTYGALLQLACKHAKPLVCFDLSGSRGMGARSLALLSEALPRDFRMLKVLRLDGSVPASEHAWLQLTESLKGLIHLEDLSLAEMQLGRLSQKSCRGVAELLPDLPGLKSLDLSGNFFGLEGCKVLARSLAIHEALERLDMSYNAGGFMMTDSGDRASRQDMKAIAGLSMFNPISLVCEGIAKARALRTLKLSASQLNFDEAFILEDALESKVGVGLQELDVSNNPVQGRMGVRCLLRIVVRHKSLERLDLFAVSEALHSCWAVPYELSDPTGDYSIDLDHPQHRALLRTLLRRCFSLGEKIENLFVFNEKSLGDEVVKQWTTKRDVPASGQLSFAFTLPLPSDENKGISSLLYRINESRKLKLDLRTFVKVAQIFSQLIEFQSRLILLDALASDILVKLSHVRYLTLADCTLRTEIVDRLLPAVHNLDRMGGFDLVLDTRKSNKVPLHVGRKSVTDLLLFNENCPDGRYVLDMQIPADRKLLEQIIIINQWQRLQAIKKQLPDLSRHGDHECLRNCTMNGVPFVWRHNGFALPPRGEVIFDYCTPWHPTTGSSSQEVIDSVRKMIKKSRCDEYLKVSVLRSALDRLCVSSEQFSQLLGGFRVPTTKEVRNSPRVEAFLILYSRCNDIQGLLASDVHGLYSLSLLTREEVLTVIKRLGRARTWDVTRIEQECLIPVDIRCFSNATEQAPAANRSSRRSSVGVSKADKQAGLIEDTLKMKSILNDFQLLDNRTSRGNANNFVMDLSLHEDWHCARMLLRIAQAEPGEHFDEPSWSEKAHLAERGSNWLVPDDWNKELPTVGIFGVRYLQGTSIANVEARLQLASEYLNW